MSTSVLAEGGAQLYWFLSHFQSLSALEQTLVTEAVISAPRELILDAFHRLHYPGDLPEQLQIFLCVQPFSVNAFVRQKLSWCVRPHAIPESEYDNPTLEYLVRCIFYGEHPEGLFLGRNGMTIQQYQERKFPGVVIERMISLALRQKEDPRGAVREVLGDLLGHQRFQEAFEISGEPLSQESFAKLLKIAMACFSSLGVPKDSIQGLQERAYEELGPREFAAAWARWA